ncbi:MFS transporter [Streptomyces sp. ACA25]|uniref:MFS transporter n=1 Tax=Streptomyces sp. ACA25 TaxID=3022596 RepID=UPI002306E785|nr:MFS transporter [Streptomyces sp. ACA25]MDB1088332.1 MFS transporter [Streptomyces sp. ACA25]
MTTTDAHERDSPPSTPREAPEEAGEEAADVVPLSRNRNYNILWTGQFFSALVLEVASVAFPLLILWHSGSPLEMGIAASLMAAAHMVAVVPAGVVADRYDRRLTMLICQGLRTLALGGLAVALAMDAYSFTLVLVVVVVEGILGSMFDPAETAAMPQVVPKSQMPTAVARNMARPYIAMLLGPAAAGLLFAINPVHPFLANTLMIAVSFLALFWLRLPRRGAPAPGEPEGGPDGPADGTGDEGIGTDRGQPAEGRTGMLQEALTGLRWITGNRILSVTMLWIMASNLFFSALIIIILATAHQDGIGAGETGLMMTCLGIGGVCGALIAARLHAALPASVIILGFSWTAAATTGAMALVPSGIALGVLLGAAALLAPVANTTLMTYQLMVTPDELRGRLSGIVSFCSGGAGALGPLIGALFMMLPWGDASGVLACAACLVVVAVFTTLSPTLRKFPSIPR